MENFPMCNIGQEMLILESNFDKPRPAGEPVEDIENDDGVENLDCCCGAGVGQNCPQTEDTAVEEVVENFELLHQAIPWLQTGSGVSSDSHKGQLKILQAAIDYIIDLEEQLTEHLSEDLYMVAIRESKAVLERSLRSRRPFADLNATDEDEDEECVEMEDNQQQPQQQQQQQQQTFAHQISAAAFLGAESALHRPW